MGAGGAGIGRQGGLRPWSSAWGLGVRIRPGLTGGAASGCRCTTKAGEMPDLPGKLGAEKGHRMKINAKDVASGVFLILLAAVGLWLNMDHTLGSARRMGPGYMPMLVFWVQLGLGTLVLVLGLFSGPDPMERWKGIDWSMLILAVVAGTLVWQVSPMFGEFFSSTYNGVGLGMLVGFLVICYALGWRLLGFICAAMCIFALLLEKGGLMLALAATILISAMAEPEHRARPLGVLGLMIFLLALCWWIFIKQLDIRVAVWPMQY